MRISSKPCTMTAPCPNCPFNKRGYIQLNPGRLRGIIDHLLKDDRNYFPCHKTTDAGGKGNNVKMCAGAMIYLLKAERPNVMMRLCAAFKSINLPKLLRGSDSVVNHPYRGTR